MDSIKFSDWKKGVRFQDSCAEPDSNDKVNYYYKLASKFVWITIYAYGAYVGLDFALDFLFNSFYPELYDLFFTNSELGTIK